MKNGQISIKFVSLRFYSSLVSHLLTNINQYDITKQVIEIHFKPTPPTLFFHWVDFFIAFYAPVFFEAAINNNVMYTVNQTYIEQKYIVFQYLIFCDVFPK